MKNRIHLIILGFAAALFLSFALLACGEGKVEEFDDSQAYNFGMTIYGSESVILKCFSADPPPYCDDYLKSLSSASAISSGSGEDPEPPVTCEEGEDCSSDSSYDGSSSSTEKEPPKIILPTECEDAEEIAQNKLMCTWENVTNSGAAIISGDSIKFKPNVYTEWAEGCVEKVYIQKGLNTVDKKVIYNTGVEATKLGTSGNLTIGSNETLKWPTSVALGTTKIDDANIVAEVVCSMDIDGVKQTLACGQKDCTPSLAIQAPPPPTITVGTDGFKFTGLDFEDNYFIGSTPTHTTITINNNAVAQCGDGTVSYRIKKVASKPTATTTPSASSGATGDVITGSLASVNALTHLLLEAYAKCRGTDYVLATAAAAVVPNPSLSGSCSWTSGGKPITGPTTTIMKGAIPGGVSLNNAYGRCGTVPVAANGTTLLPSAYGGNGITSWPENGTTGLQIGTNYNAVKPNISCTPAATVPSPNNTTCPALNVMESYSSCDAEAALATYCPSANDWNDVKFENPIPTNGNGNGPGCYYVLDITGSVNISGNHLINGVTKSGQTSAGSLPAKVDGGYYIHIPNSTWAEQSGVVTGTPYCHDKVHGIYCNLPSTAATGSSLTPSNFVTCRSGDTPTGFNWTGAPSDWNNLAVGNYNVSVSASCAGTSLASVSCGTMNVIAPTPITIVAGGSGSGTLLTTGTIYSVTCSDLSKSLDCYKASNGSFRYSINGEEGTGSANINTKIMNPCANGAVLQIIESPGGTVSCNNRGSWW